MKTLPIRLLAVLAASLLLVTFTRADDTADAGILKQRDAVLSEIVTIREGQMASGTVDEEGLASARLALWSFRRNTAIATAEKIRQQEFIAGLFEMRLAVVKNRMNAGMATREEVLVATDALLEAQQTLEELKLGKEAAN